MGRKRRAKTPYMYFAIPTSTGVRETNNLMNGLHTWKMCVGKTTQALEY